MQVAYHIARPPYIQRQNVQAFLTNIRQVYGAELATLRNVKVSGMHRLSNFFVHTQLTSLCFETELVATILLSKPDDLTENHILIQPYGTLLKTFGYFYQSKDGDCGDSSQFTWSIDEAIERANNYADGEGIAYIVILRAKSIQ